MPVIWRAVVLCALLPSGAIRSEASVAATIEAEDPSDYVRVLETEPPAPWEEAVVGLLGDDDSLPELSVSSVVRRITAVSPPVRARVARALEEHPRHPNTAETLWLLMHGERARATVAKIEAPPQAPGTSPRRAILALVREGEEVDEPVRSTDQVQQAARETLLRLHREGRLQRDWARRLEEADEEFEANAERALSERRESDEQRSGAVVEPPERSIAPSILIGSAVLSGVVGLLLFIWAIRLFQLAVRVRHRPVSRVSSLAMGPVAVEGEVQPAGAYLRHPVTGETCVYYAGADVDHPGARFYVEDGSGRVLVDPRRAVLFSDDDVLVAGERVHLVGFADRDSGGRTVIRKDETAPPLHRRIVHGAIKFVLGFGRGTSVTRMLFSDPHRCFWIWDDLERRPMGETKDVLWLAAGFLLGGAWMVVFALAVMGLIDEGTITALLQSG